jgi:serine/threonine protein phosphatase 1
VWNLIRGREKPVLPRLPSGLRVYAVGDIHGRLDLLEQVLSRIDADLAHRPPVQALQVFLGDYIDRGPASREVVERLILRGRTHASVFLKGNHELFPAAFLRDPASLDEWRQLGGAETLASYGVRPPAEPDPQQAFAVAAAFHAALPRHHREFLDRLQPRFVCGDFFFVHAGVRPGVPLAEQAEEDLLWIRDEFLGSDEDFGKVVVHGHTPVLEPDVRDNRINIDTGAYATGRLTCLVIDEDGLFVI